MELLGELIEALNKYGAGVVFMLLFLMTAFTLFKVLVGEKKKAERQTQEEIERCERLALLIEKSTNVQAAQVDMLDKLKESFDLNRNETMKLTMYLQVKDQAQAGRRNS